MPMIQLSREQFIAATEERLKDANVSVVLTNLSAAFMRFAEMHDGRADYYPELAGVVAGHLAEMAKTAGEVEDGSASVKPARKRLPRKAFMANAKLLPACAAMMGCLCAAHARGAPASSVCDATE